MRPIVLAVASLGLVAACSPGEPAPAETAEPAASEQAETADDHAAAGHDMAAMDDAMAASDASDDAEPAVTPDNYTFHTYPKKIEIVRLPLDGGGVWSGNGYADSELFKLLESKDETLADGTPVHAVRFEMLASGNGKAIFEKRASDDLDDPVLEIRTVNFMIH